MKNISQVSIVVATHKKYRMPSDKIYMPVHVGREGKEDIGYVGDNTGDNISLKNPNYCELTGLYWAWKNLDYDYLGLVHYRRHFSLSKKSKDTFDNVMTFSELEPLLKKYSVFLPKKRKYYIETLYTHYAHTHYAEHLDIAKQIISENFPEYIESCEKVYNQTYGFMFNMMIMRKDLFSDYCEWLFNILFELEKRIGKDDDNLSSFQGRFYGRVSEILFNVWLEQKLTDRIIEKSEVKELNFVYMEKIDWKRKVISFLKAKFGHKKYEGSF